MMAAILFLVSTAAFVQFGLHYWRATISSVASHAISDRIRIAACISSPSVGAQDFRNILIIKDLSPDLRGSVGSFTFIRTYYSLVSTLGKTAPAMAEWCKAEMTTCSRYVAVLMDQHLENNLACAAKIRGI